MNIVGFDMTIGYLTAIIGGVVVENDATLQSAGMLQQGDGCRTILVGEHLAVNELSAHFLGHDSRLGIDSQIGGVVQFHHAVGMWLHMNGHNGVVIKCLNAQIRQGIHAKMLLGGILYIAHIGINGLCLQVSHVVVKTYHIALIIYTQIECSASGGVEEGTDAFHHIHVLGVFIGLHFVAGWIHD